MFMSIPGQNGAKTKTRPEAVLEARHARKAPAEAGAPEMWGVFSLRFCSSTGGKHTNISPKEIHRETAGGANCLQFEHVMMCWKRQRETPPDQVSGAPEKGQVSGAPENVEVNMLAKHHRNHQMPRNLKTSNG